jgi:hypothetical protein
MHFADARFRASVVDMRFTAQGDVRVTLNVPFADKHLAIPLSEAYGLALEIHARRKRATRA